MISLRFKSLGAVAALILFSLVASNQLAAQAFNSEYLEYQKLSPTVTEHSWETDAQQQNLSAAQIGTLKNQGFVVTDHVYRQIFKPYLEASPVFITSDSIINAYSVLLEDSVLNSELEASRTLQRYLLATWNLIGDEKARAPKANAPLLAAYERDQMVIGVALELSTGEKVTGPVDLVSRIDTEAQRVTAATGQSLPAFLGPPGHDLLGLDYTRFRPVGFLRSDRRPEPVFSSDCLAGSDPVSLWQ